MKSIDIAKLQSLVSKGRSDEAIQILEDLSFSNMKYSYLTNSILQLKARLNEYKKSKIQGSIETSELLRINECLLDIIGELKGSSYLLPATSQSIIFKRTKDGFYNREFYNYFNSVISSAKKEILVTGEGFECVDAEGKKIAEDYSLATESALRNEVTIIRIQTKLDVSAYWTAKLREFLGKYPQHFRLFVSKDGKPLDLSSICIVDTNLSPQDNIVELMYSISEKINNQVVNIAGLALFVTGDHELNLNLREKFYSVKNERAIEITSDNIDAHLGERCYYFSYGANMDSAIMLDRCPSARKIGVGFKPNFKLTFNRKGTYRPGGVSSIEPAFGKKVFGIIYSITIDDLKRLDHYEDPTAYLRDETNVFLYQSPSEKIACYIYLSFPQGYTPPDPQYLKILITSSMKEDFPPWYIRELKDWESRAMN